MKGTSFKASNERSETPIIYNENKLASHFIRNEEVGKNIKKVLDVSHCGVMVDS